MFSRLAACAVAAALVAPATARGWAWPVQGPVLRGFSFGSDPYAGGLHRGIDIGAETGAPVVAPSSGTVTFAGTVPTGGKTLAIATPDGYSATLLHLGSLSVVRNAAVSEGDVVGTVGPSGMAELDVPYVYLGIRRSAEPQGYLDPLLFLPSPPPSVPPAVPPSPPEPAPVSTPPAPVAAPAPASAHAPAPPVPPARPAARPPALPATEPVAVTAVHGTPGVRPEASEAARPTEAGMRAARKGKGHETADAGARTAADARKRAAGEWPHAHCHRLRPGGGRTHAREGE
jgi:Peptidase family M23